jgi:ABC-type Fe3+ transport system substrate-binding protein
MGMWKGGRLLVALAAASLMLIAPAAAVAQKASGARADGWDGLVAAARAEGRIQLSGPRGLPAFQRALTSQFEAEYGIGIDYSGLGASEILNQMSALTPDDLAPWDVFVGGTDTLFFNLMAKDLLAPVEPALVLPEVADPSMWEGGRLPLLDEQGRAFAFLRQSGQYFFVDTSRVDPASITSFRDLLAPAWKGQILLTADPRAPGHARSAFTVFYAAPGLGRDFIRSLLSQQELVIPADDAMATELALSGKYMMCICNNAEGTELRDRGLPYRALDPHQVREGSNATSSFANLALPRHSAHPNAAIVYTNWLLSAEAGFLTSSATNVPSLRDDVAKEFLPAASVPAPEWPVANDRTGLRLSEETVQFLESVMGPLPRP